jgi:hypothetical protein
MITHVELAALRLKQILPAAKVDESDNYELLGHTWINESIGAWCGFCRLMSEPDLTRLVEVTFQYVSEEYAKQMLWAVDLPVSAGMAITEVIKILGEPVDAEAFVDDRRSYDFVVRQPDEYRIGCTLLNNGGLIYLIAHTPLPAEDVRRVDNVTSGAPDAVRMGRGQGGGEPPEAWRLVRGSRDGLR